MRAFIAVNIGKSAQDALASKLLGLMTVGPGIKWVEPGNVHLTMKFLGEIENGKAEELKGVLDSIAAGINGFEAEIAGWGCFPQGKHPRVIWAGIDKGGKELKELAEKIENGCSRAGLGKEEKGFVPHVAVGRVRDEKEAAGAIKALSGLEDGKISVFTVASIDLMKSTLKADGPEYELIHPAKLGN